jgi:hypothetical protein
MRSPEAVLEPNEYHDAPPHPVAADAAIGWKAKAAAIAEIVRTERQIFFKPIFPLHVDPCAYWRGPFQSGQTWRKSAI